MIQRSYILYRIDMFESDDMDNVTFTLKLCQSRLKIKKKVLALGSIQVCKAISYVTYSGQERCKLKKLRALRIKKKNRLPVSKGHSQPFTTMRHVPLTSPCHDTETIPVARSSRSIAHFS